MISFKHYLNEKTVIGLIETITIDGIGEVHAKVDSGNGAYCVLHGIKPKYKNGSVTFDTVNNQTITHPVVDKISINVGAGYTESRPVVELDVVIGGKKFDRVRFSVGNRATNEQPVLIGKEFIRDNLDALIDVNGKNIASQNIEVNY